MEELRRKKISPFVREKILISERMKKFEFVEHLPNCNMDLYRHKKYGFKECFWR